MKLLGPMFTGICAAEVSALVSLLQCFSRIQQVRAKVKAEHGKTHSAAIKMILVD